MRVVAWSARVSVREAWASLEPVVAFARVLRMNFVNYRRPLGTSVCAYPSEAFCRDAELRLIRVEIGRLRR
jgi:hypothetical protein